MFYCLPLELPIDLTVLTTDVQKVKARKELWELIAVYTTWMEEWKQLLFSEVTCQMNHSLLIDKMIKYQGGNLLCVCVFLSGCGVTNSGENCQVEGASSIANKYHAYP